MLASTKDIADLLARVARRDKTAFAELYRATSSKLLGIILRISKRREVAEEILQEVYVTIWARAGDFDPDRASPITWMAVIARNRALDQARRAAPLSIEDTPEALDVAGAEPSPFDALSANEDARRLSDCLDTLEPQRRELVVLAYREGASREALAARYAAPVGTIKTWLHRSLAQLRQCLGS